MKRPPPRSTLFPYTTLFRSSEAIVVSTARAPGRLTILHLHRLQHLCIVALLKGNGHLVQLSIQELDRKSTRLNSSHSQISYAVFCLKKKKKTTRHKFTNAAA